MKQCRKNDKAVDKYYNENKEAAFQQTLLARDAMPHMTAARGLRPGREVMNDPFLYRQEKRVYEDVHPWNEHIYNKLPEDWIAGKGKRKCKAKCGKGRQKVK